MYLPGASATPGSSTGPLNVKYTRSSDGCAKALAVTNKTSATTATAHQEILFVDMLPLLFQGETVYWRPARIPPETSKWTALVSLGANLVPSFEAAETAGRR